MASRLSEVPMHGSFHFGYAFVEFSARHYQNTHESMDLALFDGLTLGGLDKIHSRSCPALGRDIFDGLDITDAKELIWIEAEEENATKPKAQDTEQENARPDEKSILKYYRDDDDEFAYAGTPRDVYNAIRAFVTLPAAEHLANDETSCLICSRSFVRGEEHGEFHEIALRLPQCGHYFGIDCLFRYLSPCDDIKGPGAVSTACPLCRTRLFDEPDYTDTMLQLEARLKFTERAFEHIGLKLSEIAEQERSDLWQFISLWRHSQKPEEREQRWERGKAQYDARLRLMVVVEQYFQVIPMSLEASCREKIYRFASNPDLGREEDAELKTYLDRATDVKMIRHGNWVLLLRDEAYNAYQSCYLPYKDLALIPFLPF
ncbi:MAG: hypothetical protein Q9219_001827 [cf. Caloplaca sp. 3 TL-2023]